MPRDGISDYIDKRNWIEYNEKLVRRGELYLSLDFLDHWDEEIERTNEGKRGRPYAYPWSMMEFLGYVHNLLMPFRQIEGFLGSCPSSYHNSKCLTTQPYGGGSAGWTSLLLA